MSKAFKVSDHRKPIPAWVKIQVILNQDRRCKATGAVLVNARAIRFDHRPALWEREFNDATQDFVPPQNDPEFIEAIGSVVHDHRTFGPGGDRRTTTAGSDLNRRAKVHRLSKEEEEFRRRLLAKASYTEPELGNRKNARKLPSRPFPKRKSAYRPS